MERTLLMLKPAVVPVPVTSARWPFHGVMLTPFSLKLTGGGGGGGGAAAAPRPPPPPRRPPPPPSAGAPAGAPPAAAPPPAPPRAAGAPPAGGAASPPRPPPRPPRPPPPPPAGAAGGGGGITTPVSIHGLASVPSPLTHPMIVCSVPCAARPITATPARTNVPRTLNFMTPPPCHGRPDGSPTLPVKRPHYTRDVRSCRRAVRGTRQVEYSPRSSATS